MQWQEFWDLHRRTILIVLGGVALLIGGWLYSRPAPANPTFATAVSTKPAAVDKSKAETTPAKVCVDVKGAVNRPGVYTLGKNARVQEAIAAAGGVHTDADMRQVNLAKQLQDQQVVYVPAQGEQLPGGLTTGMQPIKLGRVLRLGDRIRPRSILIRPARKNYVRLTELAIKS